MFDLPFACQVVTALKSKERQAETTDLCLSQGKAVKSSIMGFRMAVLRLHPKIGSDKAARKLTGCGWS